MLHISGFKKYTALTVLLVSSPLQADCCLKKALCDTYETEIGSIYLKDLNRAVLAGAAGKENVIETLLLGLPILSVEEATELVTHFVYDLCKTKDLTSAAADGAIALTAAKATSYLVAALNNLGIRLPVWIKRHADINYHLVTLLKGATRNTIRGWLQGLV